MPSACDRPSDVDFKNLVLLFCHMVKSRRYFWCHLILIIIPQNLNKLEQIFKGIYYSGYQTPLWQLIAQRRRAAEPSVAIISFVEAAYICGYGLMYLTAMAFRTYE